MSLKAVENIQEILPCNLKKSIRAYKWKYGNVEKYCLMPPRVLKNINPLNFPNKVNTT